MGRHERFSFRDPDKLSAKARQLGVNIPLSRDVRSLLSPISISGRTLPNRLAIHPMEGADADGAGGPGDLTFRRYERFGAGGCGLIWFEAAAVVPSGRSNPRQLQIAPRNLDAWKRLVERTRAAAGKSGGPSRDPFLILQLTHSGRFSKPSSIPAPVIARHHPALDAIHGLGPDSATITDEELDRLRDDFAGAAALAEAAGFDGVDVKACHGYLVSELLAAFDRKGRYGGSLENRSRFLRETLSRIRERAPKLSVAVRLNAADMLPFPGGFGDDPNLPRVENLAEPKELLRELARDGVAVANITVGVPHLIPHYGRPFDRPVRGGAIPDEHPLEGVARLSRITAELQRAVPTLPLVGTGFSWLRHLAPYVAAGTISSGGAALAGFGRMAFAYPDFARDLAQNGGFDPKKACLACSGCSELARAGFPAGCVVRDRSVYRRITPQR
jgi:2,4-dienoyl-CoA reductase-like NADH-dependent reductase (Old Yellow Enzyme family)